MPTYLIGFKVIRPRFELEQERSLEWIAQAHARAEAARSGRSDPSFLEEIKKGLFKVGFGKDKIQKRGIQIEDFFSNDWAKMSIYPLDSSPLGVGFKGRSQAFNKEVSGVFDAFYPEGSSFPDHLIHVTCTGYVAPSPAQQIVSRRDQGEKTAVTHAYHMGCYASIPALRIGSGYLHLPSPATSLQVDIVHTEVCSLHMHPLKHSIEQLIVQSLFADGFIKYSLTNGKTIEPGPALLIHSLHEETIPDTLASMTWSCEDHGLAMTLAKEVPAQISSALPGFIQRLWKKAGLQERRRTLFAVHPGGPKILLQVQQLLGLEPEQLRHSQEILKTCGNMSSATLPHIWNLILSDDQVLEGTQIVSLAFGPGLSISGALFEKRRN